jgi:hypothetical protein
LGHIPQEKRPFPHRNGDHDERRAAVRPGRARLGIALFNQNVAPAFNM